MKKLCILVMTALFVSLLSVGTMGCRGGAGSDCLSESDCQEGLVCIKRSKRIKEKDYIEKWGVCYKDTDVDGIPDDGNLSDSTIDLRCGVFASIHPETGAEWVRGEEIGDCDDNCPDVVNSELVTKFGCLARDPCCVLHENPETDRELKSKIDGYKFCHEVEGVVRDKCSECMAGAWGQDVPERCYLEFKGGYDVTEMGCFMCRPLAISVPCTHEEGVDSCKNNPDLPALACSGAWECDKNTGLCKLAPRLFNDVDDDGYSRVYQLDRDGDALGDVCDNCPEVPNGIECDNPIFEHHCDINGDGGADAGERQMGNQANDDGDRWGDACDLCPGLADDDNDDPDRDGLANPCDPDDDGDGTIDEDDNCPDAYNPNQGNIDMDDLGDACDFDKDGDEIREDGNDDGRPGGTPCNPTSGPCCDDPPCANTADVGCRNCDDNCPEVPNRDQLDDDEDGIGNACE